MTTIDDFLKEQEVEGYNPNIDYHPLRVLTQKEFRIDVEKQMSEIQLYYRSERFNHKQWNMNDAANEFIQKYGRAFRNYLTWDRFYRNPSNDK